MLPSRVPGIKEVNGLSEMMDDIVFENDDAKMSFTGIVLLLSRMYFSKNDPVRKKIQGEYKIENLDKFMENFGKQLKQFKEKYQIYFYKDNKQCHLKMLKELNTLFLLAASKKKSLSKYDMLLDDLNVFGNK